MTENEIKEKLLNLPLSPGVYLMKDSAGKIIYIGKAKVLRHRVKAYFSSAVDFDPKTAALREKIADFELMVTDNEIEALILEANLVKQHQPRYNINLKDDKSFPYLKITREPFPRLLVTRRVSRDDGIYFGPYANVGRMRETHRLIMRLFKLRDCSLTIPHPRGATYKVCLQYHIKHCDGPCENLITMEQYDKEVQKVIKLLQGKTTSLLDQLESEMSEYSAKQEYEDAARVRDQIAAVRAVMQKQKVVTDEQVNRDIIAFARSAADLAVVVLQLREGLLIGRQNFHLRAEHSDSETDIASAFLKQYYLNSSHFPAEIFLSYKTDEQELLEEWLSEKLKSRVYLHFPQKGEKLKLVEMAESNARLFLSEILRQRQERAEKLPQLIETLQKDLYLARPPVTICAFDISNLGSSDVVGSMVFFKNGKPFKKHYRHFKIKTVTGQDDFRSMQEIVLRHFTHILSGDEEMPDLCLIDGGRGQLNAALSALGELGIDDLQICGLAKRLEEIVLPTESKMLSLPKTSSSLKLLQRVRDEAHRFAITYHKKLRDQKTTASALDSLKGVGPKRKEQLLRAFGSVEGIKSATIEELERELRNHKLAESIKKQLEAVKT